jgi:uncharacterized protein (TIGR03067 family)
MQCCAEMLPDLLSHGGKVKMIGRVITIVIVASSIMLSGCQRTPDQEHLKGSWELREMTGDFTFDLKLFLLNDKDMLAFDTTDFTYSNNLENPEIVKGSFECDQTKKPKEITFKFANRKVVGVYSLSGDVLTICVGENDDRPPKTFAAGTWARPAILRFCRRRPVQ